MRRILRNRNRRGNALLELALMASILFPVLTGVTQFGYSFFVYNNLQTAVRSAGRYASMRTYTSTTSTPTQDFVDEVKNLVVYGKPNAVTSGVSADKPIVKGLSISNVEVVVTMNGSVPGKVTVRIVNLNVDGIFTQYTFHQKPSATFPYNG
jgi:Flp pilus assembly protein TadG